MAKFAVLVRLDARPGKEAEVEAFLKSAQALANDEPGTRSWYALRMAPQIFAIYDTFDDEADRDAHLQGRIAAGLLQRAPELLSRPPVIEQVTIIAAKNG